MSAVSIGFISTSSMDVNGILALSGVMLPAQILYTGSTCLQPCFPPQEEQMQMAASLAAASWMKTAHLSFCILGSACAVTQSADPCHLLNVISTCRLWRHSLLLFLKVSQCS